MEQKYYLSKDETRKRVRQIESSQDDTACIIFGAGASYGYSNQAFFEPPVVTGLFNKNNSAVKKVINSPEHSYILNNYEDILDQLANYNNDLEKYLSSLYKGNTKDNIFGNFLSYLEDIFFTASEKVENGRSNNYKSLINLMWDLHKKKKWSCISFNYDTILEQSYLFAGRDPDRSHFNDIHNYSNGNPTILKIHGSINFRYIYKKPAAQNDLNAHTKHVLFSKMMMDANPSSNYQELINIGALRPSMYSTQMFRVDEIRVQHSVFNFPLMLIPIHDSISPENAFFKECLDKSKTLVGRSSLVIAIGYNFGDEAFLAKMKEIDFSNKEIILVSTRRSIEDLNNHIGFQRVLRELSSAKISVFEGDGFGEFVAAIR